VAFDQSFRDLNSKLKNQAAFTLIELLVVIAIIAVLAALLVPSLKEALERSRGIACSVQMRGLHQAVILYTQDYELMLPKRHHPAGDEKPVLTISNGWDNRGPARYWGWVEGVADQILDDYVGVGAVQAFFCPSDPTAGDPGEPPAMRTKYSYAWNTHLIVDFGDTFTPPGGGHHFWSARPLEEIHPQTAVLGDRNFLSEIYISAFQHARYEDTLHIGWFSSHPFSSHGPGYAHLGKANIAFLDGHIEPMDRGDILRAGSDFWYGGH